MCVCVCVCVCVSFPRTQGLWGNRSLKESLYVCAFFFFFLRAGCLRTPAPLPRPGISLEWLSELGWLLMSIPWQVAYELDSLMHSQNTSGQHKQPVPTSLGNDVCVFRYNLPPALLAQFCDVSFINILTTDSPSFPMMRAKPSVSSVVNCRVAHGSSLGFTCPFRQGAVIHHTLQSMQLPSPHSQTSLEQMQRVS